MEALKQSHAQIRATQRYGLKLKHDDFQEIIAQIENKHNAWLISHEDKDVSKWYIIFKGKAIRLVFNEVGRKIITFLPLGLKPVLNTKCIERKFTIMKKGYGMYYISEGMIYVSSYNLRELRTIRRYLLDGYRLGKFDNKCMTNA